MNGPLPSVQYPSSVDLLGRTGDRCSNYAVVYDYNYRRAVVHNGSQWAMVSGQDRRAKKEKLLLHGISIVVVVVVRCFFRVLGLLCFLALPALLCGLGGRFGVAPVDPHDDVER